MSKGNVVRDSDNTPYIHYIVKDKLVLYFSSAYNLKRFNEKLPTNYNDINHRIYKALKIKSDGIHAIAALLTYLYVEHRIFKIEHKGDVYRCLDDVCIKLNILRKTNKN